MAIPIKSDILAAIQTLRSYPELYVNGQLTNESIIVLEALSADVSTGGGTVTFPPFLANSAFGKVKDANDFQLTISYFDPGTSDERVSTVKYKSQSLASEYTDTSTYLGSAGSYRLVNVIRTFAAV